MDMFKRLAIGIFVWFVLASPAATATEDQVLAKTGCPSHCGNVSIPYPFGTRPGCYLNKNFYIKCGKDCTNSTKATLGDTNFVVRNISMEGRLQILAKVIRHCYRPSGRVREWGESWFEQPNFKVSTTRNKFTAIGCNTSVYLIGYVGNNKSYSAGCVSVCNGNELDVVNGSCSGYGCCQIEIPEGMNTVLVMARTFRNHTTFSGFNHYCSYAFPVEEDQFVFSTNYFRSIPNMFPLSLDWVVGNEKCEEAKNNTVNYTCQHQSECYEPGINPGYLCKCSDGYEGNPYLPEGCLDIDECQNVSSPCDKNAECYNTPGGFNCTCRDGYEGDGRINGTGCSPIRKVQQSSFVNIVVGASLSILALVLSLSWIYWALWHRKLIKQREKFFQRNGGLILQQELSKHKGAVSTEIFTAKELKKATNNYHESRILGQGGHGTVYRGILQDNKVVAIKKSKIADHKQVEEFINEVIVLSQVNHRNVVKLLGCCLETEVPLLVYEFISNGTLYHHLHDSCVSSSIPWETRLRIATETAGVLSYLHSAAYPPIIHRDVKSTNILLDDHYTAKVSDFGASVLVPSDQTQLTTLVQGTLGYLDPEYFQTSQLTEKSDVYSFGVVLAELLTGRKALCFQLPEEERNLAMYFVSALSKDRLFDIIDHNVLLEENKEQLKQVAMLAKSCLGVRGEERPSMKEVAMELEGLRAKENHPWVEVDASLNETECLLGELPDANSQGTSGRPSGYDDSIQQEILVHGR